MYLSGFDFEVKHRPGKSNPADGPSRRPDYQVQSACADTLLPTLQRKLKLAEDAGLHLDSEGASSDPEALQGAVRGSGGDARILHTSVARYVPADRCCDEAPVAGATGCIQYVPRSVARVLATSEAAGNTRFLRMLKSLQAADDFARVKSAESKHLDSAPGRHSTRLWHVSDDGLLYYRTRLYIPAEEAMRQEIIAKGHDTHMSGHQGASTTHELLTRSYFWPRMEQDVKEYVKSCLVCQRMKTPRRTRCYSHITFIVSCSQYHLDGLYTRALPSLLQQHSLHHTITRSNQRNRSLSPSNSSKSARDGMSDFTPINSPSAEGGHQGPRGCEKRLVDDQRVLGVV